MKLGTGVCCDGIVPSLDNKARGIFACLDLVRVVELLRCSSNASVHGVQTSEHGVTIGWHENLILMQPNLALGGPVEPYILLDECQDNRGLASCCP